MQSKHTFQFLDGFLKKCDLKSEIWVHFVAISCQKQDLCVKKEVSKNRSKNSTPPDAKGILSAGLEAPGEAASRAHCTNKKQLFEQQLKQCSRF